MAQPVVHFEIIGRDPQRLRDFYGTLFGWEFDTSAPVSAAVSGPDDYGFTEPGGVGEGPGIPGGVGGGPDYAPRVIFYVGVEDVPAALQRAEDLGGERRLGPDHARPGLVIGQFTDPEGNLVGVAGPD